MAIAKPYGIGYGIVTPVVDGPPKSDLVESLSVGSFRRGIQKPHFELVCEKGNGEVFGIHAELIGLISHDDDGEEWQMLARTVSSVRDTPSHFFVAVFSTRTRKGALTFYERHQLTPFIFHVT